MNDEEMIETLTTMPALQRIFEEHMDWFERMCREDLVTTTPSLLRTDTTGDPDTEKAA